MANLIMWSPLRRVIMSLYTRGREISVEYSKWNSSVSKSSSGNGCVASELGGPVVPEDENV
jgi:hypothetical protein